MPVPRVRVHCKSAHVRGFLELLDSGQRLELLPLREVDFSRACGVFAVAKDGDRDRMVLDARPANAYEAPENPSWVRSLAAAAPLCFPGRPRGDPGALGGHTRLLPLSCGGARTLAPECLEAASPAARVSRFGGYAARAGKRAVAGPCP